MPKFSYVAMDSRGKETKGTLEVANQNEAIGRIKEMGFFPTKVVEDKGAAPAVVKKTAKGKKGGGGALNLQIKIPGLSGRVKSKVLCTFTRQLATLVQAGLPLLRGLRVLQKQEKSANLKTVLGELAVRDHDPAAAADRRLRGIEDGGKGLACGGALTVDQAL